MDFLVDGDRRHVFISVIPSEIRRIKFTVSWLCDDHTAAGIFVVKGSRHRAMTATSPCCRRTTVFKGWRNTDCLPRGGSLRGWGRLSVQGADKRVKCCISHSLRAAFYCVETEHPSSLHVSIMWFTCELGPLIWGIGACAQWTSTSAVRRLRSLTDE
jgi:hypothetical protein